MTKAILRYYLRLMLFLMPIVFLPVVIDSFGTGKNLILFALTLIGLILWIVDFLATKQSEIKYHSALGWMLILVIWAWLGWWIRLSAGIRMRSLLDGGGVGTLTYGLIWMFLWLQIASVSEKKIGINWLTASGMVVLVLSIAIFLYPAAKFPIIWPKDNPMLTINSAWSLTGSLLGEVLLMIFLAIEWGRRLLLKLKNSEERDDSYIGEAILMALMTLGSLLSLFRLAKIGFVNLDNHTSWVIAVEVFKRSPIWGIGVGNFTQAFSSFRPIEYNLTSYWANGFKYSSMGILQLWTELGIVGLGIVLLGFLSFLRQRKKYDFFRLLVVIIGVAWLPFNLIGWLFLLWLAAVSIFEVKRINIGLKVGEGGFNIAPWLLSSVGIIGIVAGGYWIYRMMMAEITMRQSMLAASKNNGGDTYNLQIKAIGMLPKMAEYRRIYSQTNLALASTLLTNKNIADEDKQKASVLVQQSVREAKAAIALENNNPVYWNNLASIYRQIVGVVDGAADWSFQAYQQAVALEPSNPVSKLEMGGLLFAANRFDEADRVFEQVVTIKNDYPNGWYNFAYSGKKMGKLADAVARLSQAVDLVPASSADYDKASLELADWKKELEAQNKKANQLLNPTPTPTAEVLKTAEPLPTVGKEEKVVIPLGELAPPKVTPMPTEIQ